MAYIGNLPVPQATQTRDRFVASSGQPIFNTRGYTPGFVDVYVGGVRLDSEDFTSNDGVHIVLKDGALEGQIVQVVAQGVIEATDKLPIQSGNSGKVLTTDGVNTSWLPITAFSEPVSLKGYSTTERNALTNLSIGDVIFNTTTGSLEYYNGSEWIATNLIPSLISAEGRFVTAYTSSITITATNVTDQVDVVYSLNSVEIDIVTVTGINTSTGVFTTTVPSNVYAQSPGTQIQISIRNNDGTPSTNSINKNISSLPTGGIISSAGNYRVHTFLTSGTFSTPYGLSLDALIVGGGGAGGLGSEGGGGGGGGGVLVVNGTGTSTAANMPVVVGSGGAGATSQTAYGGNGGNSSFNTYVAFGGGAGGCDNALDGRDGGCGGGGAGDEQEPLSRPAGFGTSGQGFNGGAGIIDYGGGGGGAGTPGESGTSGSSPNDGGDGGDGKANTFRTGSTQYYGGGGGGGGNNLPTVLGGSANNDGMWGYGGQGGGGNGCSDEAERLAISGVANTGGGGGGGEDNTPAGSGGSGIVVIRYDRTAF
jgi:hypothetical protein